MTLRAPKLATKKSYEMRNQQKQRNQRKFLKGTISAIIEIFRKIRYQHVQNNNFCHIMNCHYNTNLKLSQSFIVSKM